MDTERPRKAFVVRVNPGQVNKLKETLESNQAILGWAELKGLLDSNLSHSEVREQIFRIYRKHDKNKIGAGNNAAQVRRFIYDIKTGDYILIPAGGCFYIAQAAEDDAVYLPEKVKEDSAYRRNLNWRNGKKAIKRALASSALQSRLKSRQTVIDACDLINDIERVLQQVEDAQQSTNFVQDLQAQLAEVTLNQLQTGKMNPNGFEQFIRQLLLDLGAKSAKVTAKNQDNGVDVSAIFPVGSFSQIQVAVQAKHYQPKPAVPADVVKQLIRGIEHDDFNNDIPVIGMVVTTGEFSDEAQQYAQEYMESEDCRCLDLKLIDGAELARLVVENGIYIQ